MNRGLQTICEQLGKTRADLLTVGVALDECVSGALATPADLEHLVAGMRDRWEKALRDRFPRHLVQAMLDAAAEAFKARMVAKTCLVAQDMRGLAPLKIVM
ncbi:hypothetical protein [Xanthobacter aminoxidans]|uniref:hypothetical protein n=1 Tax=Xanthobacter aminoxidans TaxID=186280 RepID=UPI002022E91A|nr:hypothetical protein [Xanthobacter aminoxidans]MCL8382484.1 hypothetical protein [Xanthobacter aminoxidans]